MSRRLGHLTPKNVQMTNKHWKDVQHRMLLGNCKLKQQPDRCH